MKRQTGFTLIELMVVLAVLAILALVGYPLYTAQVQKARRHDAQGLLMIAANELEQRRASQPNIGYQGFTLGSLNELWDPPTTTAPFNAFGYGFVVEPASLAFAYEVKATPSAGGGQEDDRCGVMSINQEGNKVAAADGCWK